MNNRTNQKTLMDYVTFKRALKENIQDCVGRPVHFTETKSQGMYETLESIILQLDGEGAATLIHPQRLYEAYRAGISLPKIAVGAVDIAKGIYVYPEIPVLTPENAKKHIRYSLINKAWSQKLLQTCPSKEVLDLAAVPRWFTRESSFPIDNNVLQILKMTADEVLGIAETNTELSYYQCLPIGGVICEALNEEGRDVELADELYPNKKTPLYVLTNQTGVDGSCAILSDRFLQEAAQQIGTDKLCLIPSSRNEMLAANIADVDNIAELKKDVMSVKRNLRSFLPGGALSNSVYCYNANKHLLSILQ